MRHIETEYAFMEMPREKCMSHGVSVLSDQELIALILCSGSKGKDVLDISHEIIKKFGNFARIARSTISEISQMTGIGSAKACSLLAACEIGLRFRLDSVKGDPVICSRNIFERYQRIALNDRESFHAVSLNARNRITGEWKISEGSLHQCALSPRDIFSVLMREGSFQVIFIHNHPSGDPVPSQEDIEFTSRLVKAGSILGIKVLDHIIIAGNSYTSLKDEGKITM